MDTRLLQSKFWTTLDFDENNIFGIPRYHTLPQYVWFPWNTRVPLLAEVKAGRVVRESRQLCTMLLGQIIVLERRVRPRSSERWSSLQEFPPRRAFVVSSRSDPWRPPTPPCPSGSGPMRARTPWPSQSSSFGSPCTRFAFISPSIHPSIHLLAPSLARPTDRPRDGRTDGRTDGRRL